MSTTARSTARIGLLQVCAAGVLWGTGGLAVKLIRRHCDLSALTISTWRMVIAAVALLALVAARGEFGELRRLLAAHPLSATLTGVSVAAYQALYFGAVVNVGVAVSTVVSLGLAPMLITVYESARSRRRPSREQLLVLTVALIGLALVSVDGGNSVKHAHTALGLILAVGAGVLYAAGTLIAQPATTASTSPIALSTIGSCVGAITLLVVTALFGSAPYTTGNPAALGWLLYLGVVSLAAAYSLFYAGLAQVSGSVAVLGTLLEPVTAAIAAMIVLGERLGALSVLGTLLILLAVAGIGQMTPAADVPSAFELEAPPPP